MSNKCPTSYRLSPATLDKLRVLADEDMRSTSNWIEVTVAREYEKLPPEKKTVDTKRSDS